MSEWAEQRSSRGPLEGVQRMSIDEDEDYVPIMSMDI